MGASRTTARRYVEYLVTTGECRAELAYGIIGRPERKYYPAKNKRSHKMKKEYSYSFWSAFVQRSPLMKNSKRFFPEAQPIIYCGIRCT